ncbi:MAG: NAD(P)-dependent glycerol-3-phosphate dehydrogenase [Litoreibacter sp.]|nr:NAD(P)-dependent glycerol-3-phosphate dehydrogenase [Litoreibacter sp.]MCY4333516.1 NAD(P)-dependent glycerol-3-phosphate dehydrogenase [Litoreibacter sp.]
MSKIFIAGAGAFGTALALAIEKPLTLTARDMSSLVDSRISPKLPGVVLPHRISLEPAPEIGPDDVLLAVIPMQALARYLADKPFRPKASIACCKGIELETMRGPSAVLHEVLDCPTAVLTGPSFASDISQGKPTALTLACADETIGQELQEALTSDTLRLYLSDDPVGAELGGALKNVIAIACGICMGAGLGESARAALMTRGMAETTRLSLKLGAKPETLSGLSGFGDLALTCTSPQSRNFSFGFALGAGEAPEKGKTVEGRATAEATLQLARKHGIEMPITSVVASLISEKLTIQDALAQLLSRPLTSE